MAETFLVPVVGKHCFTVWKDRDSDRWVDIHECNREPGHDGRHRCVCGSWKASHVGGES